jgi:O-antigen/teichoic acid export membrane protein
MLGNNATEVNEYAYGFRIFDALNNFGSLAAMFLFAFFVANRANWLLITKLARQYCMIGMILLAVATAVIYYNGTTIVTALYKTCTDKMLWIIFYCTLAFGGTWLVHIYSSILTAFAETKKLIQATSAIVIISILLNVLFIPRYGAKATALILLFCQWLHGIMLYILCSSKKINTFANAN